MARQPIDGPLILKQGDTGPIYILCEDEGGPALLNGALALFKMRRQDGLEYVERSAIPVDPLAVEPDEDAGWVVADLTAPDTNVPGLYRGEVRVTYSPGTPQEEGRTYPAGQTGGDSYIDIIIRPSV